MFHLEFTTPGWLYGKAHLYDPDFLVCHDPKRRCEEIVKLPQ